MRVRVIKPMIQQASMRARKLARMLIKEAANEGATIQDLETAGEIAAAAYKTAMRSASLTEFQREAESAFD